MLEAFSVAEIADIGDYRYVVMEGNAGSVTFQRYLIDDLACITEKITEPADLPEKIRLRFCKET